MTFFSQPTYRVVTWAAEAATNDKILVAAPGAGLRIRFYGFQCALDSGASAAAAQIYVTWGSIASGNGAIVTSVGTDRGNTPFFQDVWEGPENTALQMSVVNLGLAGAPTVCGTLRYEVI